jgi:LacI family transcriptional regulator
MEQRKSAQRRHSKARTGGRMASIYDVAHEARVSPYTVSAVVNQVGQVSSALQKRVENAIKKLNYSPNLLARSLARRQTHTIGIIVPDIANPFFPLVVRGAEDTLHHAGYSTLLCNSDDQLEKEARYLELLLSRRVDGILLTKTPGKLSPALARMLSDTEIPVTLLMRTSAEIKRADVVLTDDAKGAYDAVMHLARIGHRRIAYVGGPRQVSNARARRQGYLKALQEYRLKPERDLMFEGEYRLDSGYAAGSIILPRQPDAVFAANYLIMAGLMKAAVELKRSCPDDFAMVSFDDYPWLACFRPRMTTVELPKYEVGSTGAKLLLERISGERTKPVTEHLMPQLRVRESCGFTLHTRRPAQSEAAAAT